VRPWGIRSISARGLSRWDGLVRFLADGRIEVDSSVVERAIRPIDVRRFVKKEDDL